MKISRARRLVFAGFEYPYENLLDDNDHVYGKVVGKVRDWDKSDNEYIVYDDGDFFLVEKKNENHT